MRRYDCPLSLSGASRVARLPDTLPASMVRGVPYGLVTWSKRPVHARAFGHPVPHSGYATRRQVTLPSSRVPPVKTCPALRPRWCPAHSPYCAQDCCLPATGNSRLASPYTLERYPRVHDYTHFEAPSRGLPPRYTRLRTPLLAETHAGSLLTCWRGFRQVGLAPYRLVPTG